MQELKTHGENKMSVSRSLNLYDASLSHIICIKHSFQPWAKCELEGHRSAWGRESLENKEEQREKKQTDQELFYFSPQHGHGQDGCCSGQVHRQQGTALCHLLQVGAQAHVKELRNGNLSIPDPNMELRKGTSEHEKELKRSPCKGVVISCGITWLLRISTFNC